MGKMTGKQKRGSRTIWLVAGAATLVVAALIGFSVVSSRGGQSGPQVASDKELGAVRNVKGQSNAKVTITEFNDYL